VDQEYAYQVLESFSRNGLPPHIWYLLFGILFVVAVLTIIILWFNNKELRKKVKQFPPSWITDQTEIRQIMDTALLSRSKIDISFHSASEKRKTIPCSILESDPELKLELPVSGKQSGIMLEKNVDIFFSIPTRHKGQYIFYKFTSQVIACDNTGSHISQCVIKTPDHLEQTQHREYLRISPPSRLYDYVNILPEMNPFTKECIEYVKTNGEIAPEDIFGEDSQIILGDISGGGLSLEITKFESSKANDFNFARGKNFLVLLGLVDTGSKGILRYLFLCKIRRFYLDHVQNKAQIGLSFENLFSGFDEETGNPKWLNLEGQGCKQIDDWAYNVYLELYREGLD
jgi:hypothetical protein